MNKEIMIGNHKISEDSPTFVIAEMSANHLMDFDRAVAIMQVAFLQNAEIIKLSRQHQFPQFRPVVETVAVGNILGHISHDRIGTFAQTIF